MAFFPALSADEIIFTGTHLFVNFQRVAAARKFKNLQYFFKGNFIPFFFIINAATEYNYK